MSKVLRRQRTPLGRVIRDIGRQLQSFDTAAREQMQVWLERAERIRSQLPKDKLYALHALEMECMARAMCASRTSSGGSGYCSDGPEGTGGGARSFPGNSYDGDTLEEQLEQVEIVSDTKPTMVIVDLGYRSRKVEGVNVLHRGKPKSLTRRQ